MATVSLGALTQAVLMVVAHGGTSPQRKASPSVSLAGVRSTVDMVAGVSGPSPSGAVNGKCACSGLISVVSVKRPHMGVGVAPLGIFWLSRAW